MLSPGPMLANGSPFCMSFSKHSSNAKAATLKKNPFTFSPKKYTYFYTVSVPHTHEWSQVCELSPVLAETDQNSACISVAILIASFSVLFLSSKGWTKHILRTKEN